MKNAIRFHVPSVRAVLKPVFNRDPIFRSKSISDFSGTVFNRNRDRENDLKIDNRFFLQIIAR